MEHLCDHPTLPTSYYEREVRINHLLSGSFHEAKNTFLGIKLLAANLNDRITESDIPAIREKKEIKELAGRMYSYCEIYLGMMLQMVEYVKSEARSIEDSSPEELHTRSFIQEITNYYEATANEKKIILDIRISDHLPDTISADKVKLMYICMVLLSNAINFSSSGQTVRVKFQKSKDNWLFSVQDQGKGISKENLTRIFDPFAPTTNNEFNTVAAGVGLPLAKSLAEFMGGDISVVSRIGIGSCFSVLIPKRQGLIPGKSAPGM